MGVYHLMGLGLSAGAVVGPVSYLAHRFTRGSEDDRAFFARSGERAQRQKGDPVGAVQALVLFTTAEVIAAAPGAHAWKFVDNAPGSPSGAQDGGGPMRDLLRTHLPSAWRGAAGGHATGDVYWCEVDRADLVAAYARVVRVVAALAGAGGQGKEMWANLTGGNNVINLALQLAASLSGEVSRLYYVHVDDGARACLRFPCEEPYWVELPALPLAPTAVGADVIRILQDSGPLPAADIWALLAGSGVHWAALEGMDAAAFVRAHLTPLWKAGLVEDVSPARHLPDERKVYGVGPRWAAAEPYLRELSAARQDGRTLDELAEAMSWLTRETLELA
jgi:hypothetical protein